MLRYNRRPCQRTALPRPSSSRNEDQAASFLSLVSSSGSLCCCAGGAAGGSVPRLGRRLRCRHKVPRGRTTPERTPGHPLGGMSRSSHRQCRRKEPAFGLYYDALIILGRMIRAQKKISVDVSNPVIQGRSLFPAHGVQLSADFLTTCLSNTLSKRRHLCCCSASPLVPSRRVHTSSRPRRPEDDSS